MNPHKLQGITYKTIGQLRIELDLMLPPNAHRVPVLLYFHGGGLLQGRRDVNVPPHMLKGITQHRYGLVSADYRLAPQVGVREILEDVQDCITFIRTQLAEHVGADVLDTSRLAVAGSSAGGYLTLLAGLYATPKPNALLCIYPITDPLGQFFTTSQAHLLGESRVDHAVISEFLDPNADVVTNNAPGNESNRNKLYNYMLEMANFAELLHIEPGNEAFRIAKNIFQHRLPPTYIVHPDADIDVGVEQSDEVVGAMIGLGLEVVYKRPHDQGHGFDLNEQVGLEDMYTFLVQHL